MGKFKDLTGQKFNHLTVIGRAENNSYNHVRWLCRCDCGNIKVILGDHLRHGIVKSCGCLRGQEHHKTKTALYNAWIHIKQRCFNPNNNCFDNYGGRGITVYPAWIDDFQAFYSYVSKLEHFGEKGYTLDRIDNNGNYEPGNLRWADRKTQAHNKSNNIIVEYNGEMMILADAAKASGIKYPTLLRRVKNGDRAEEIFRPVKNR